jgi:hypothetical protein
MRLPMKLHPPSARLLIATTAAATVASLALALSTPATISIDGQRIASDVAPVTAWGKAYLPLRAISEASGAQTTIDQASGTIVVRRRGEVLEMRLGDRHARHNGVALLLTHAPFTVHGRTMVPSSAIAAALGSRVHYDTRHANIDVRSPGVVVAGAPDDSDNP